MFGVFACTCQTWFQSINAGHCSTWFVGSIGILLLIYLLCVSVTSKRISGLIKVHWPLAHGWAGLGHGACYSPLLLLYFQFQWQSNILFGIASNRSQFTRDDAQTPDELMNCIIFHNTKSKRKYLCVSALQTGCHRCLQMHRDQFHSLFTILIYVYLE